MTEKTALFGFPLGRSKKLDQVKNVMIPPDGSSETPKPLNPTQAVNIVAEDKKNNPPATSGQRGDNFNLDNIDWLKWALTGGGGLIAYSLASSLFDNKTNEEKRKESIWMKLLSSLAPLGIAGLGAYGGYRLGDMMKTSEDHSKVLGEILTKLAQQGPAGTGPMAGNVGAGYSPEDVRRAKEYISDIDKEYQDVISANGNKSLGWGVGAGVADAAAVGSGINWWRAKAMANRENAYDAARKAHEQAVAEMTNAKSIRDAAPKGAPGRVANETAFNEATSKAREAAYEAERLKPKKLVGPESRLVKRVGKKYVPRSRWGRLAAILGIAGGAASAISGEYDDARQEYERDLPRWDAFKNAPATATQPAQQGQ